ncbi:MAG: hypothetical protein Q8N51_05120, partial [Gammaproteobacteria bacterium]|nr:hypothetical protein [Gammaproteobacteria bacterium]
MCLAGLFAQAPAVAAEVLLRFELDVTAGKSLAAARVIVRQGDGALREVVLDSSRLQNVSGDG